MHNIYIYILIMAAVSYAVRALPLTLIQKQIKNKFLRSFLYYVPYVALAVMTFPTMVYATQDPISGIIALVAGIVAAWLGADLLTVAITCCGSVFIAELILPLLGL